MNERMHGAAERAATPASAHLHENTTHKALYTQVLLLSRVRCGVCRPDCVSVRVPSCLGVHCLPLAGLLSAATFRAAQRTTWRVFSPRTSPS